MHSTVQYKPFSPMVPPSKSRVARALAIALLRGDKHFLEQYQNSPTADIQAFAKAALSLLEATPPSTLHLNQSGTALRLLTAISALTTKHTVRLTGNEQLLQRPVAPLVTALQRLGACISYEGRKGFCPLIIRPSKMVSGSINAQGWESSQYITALLLIAPLLPHGIQLRLAPDAPSAPYIKLTVAMMQEAGANVTTTDEEIRIAPAPYVCTPNATYGDWGCASYWIGLQSLCPQLQQLRIKGLSDDPYQPDAHIVNLLPGIVCTPSVWHSPNCSEPTEGLLFTQSLPRKPLPDSIDLKGTPDLFPLLAVCYCVRRQPVTLTGLTHLRVKESDRPLVMLEVLQRLGYQGITSHEGTWHYNGSAPQLPAQPQILIPCADDHRIAMSAAIAAAALGITINLSHPHCVQKSYPNFWLYFNQVAPNSVVS